MIERKCKMISSCLLLLLLYEININEMLFLMLEYSVYDGDLFIIYFLILFLIFIE